MSGMSRKRYVTQSRAKEEIQIAATRQLKRAPLSGFQRQKKCSHFGSQMGKTDILANRLSLLEVWLYWSKLASDKAKPLKRRGRKATGPRSLRGASCDATKAPKIAEPPKFTCYHPR